MRSWSPAPGKTAGCGQGTGYDSGLLLVATGDVAVGLPLGELEHVDEASYVARGRVEDVRRGRLRLRLDNGFVLPVEVGPYRNRADYRDHAEVPGQLTLRR